MALFSYALADSPCADVAGQTLCVFPQNVCSQYPDDELLAQMSIQSYCGAPLVDRQKRAQGVLVGLGRQPLADP